MQPVVLVFILTHLIKLSHSQSIIHSLPGYDGDLPFKLETGYVGLGENEELQLFYYFVESQRNPENDPVILYIPGGPGASALISISYGRAGPLSFNDDNGLENLTISLNPYSWTKTASIIFVDIPAGTGFSYARTKEAWVSSDSIMASQATDFVKKFLIDHPKFLKNPLYVAGISYMGIVIPVVTLQLYEGNERGDQPSINIQGYIIFSPLTDKFMDFNSRLEYAHRMALISDNIYKLATENCQGNYLNTNTANPLCAYSLQRYEQCTRQLNIENILEPPCSDVHPTPNCASYFDRVLHFWANRDEVQQALNVRQGTIGTWVLINDSLHYGQGKKDNPSYSYDIFSSVAYHKKLTSRNCRALIFSGDHDLTFPYVGVQQWISSLNISIEVPWKPYYVDSQVAGYETIYAQNNFSLTFATVKGAGHLVPVCKPKESMEVVERWLASPTLGRDGAICDDV